MLNRHPPLARLAVHVPSACFGKDVTIMSIHTKETIESRAHRRHAPRERGYRIRVWYQGRPVGRDLPTLWAVEPAIPAEWEALQKDPRVTRAILIRSGKRFASFTRS